MAHKAQKIYYLAFKKQFDTPALELHKLAEDITKQAPKYCQKPSFNQQCFFTIHILESILHGLYIVTEF